MPAKKQTTTVHTHTPRPHVVRNANHVHKERQQQGNAYTRFNRRFALWIATHVGSMNCFYIFNVIALIIILGAVGAFGRFSALVVILGAIISSYWLQLVLLPGVMVGQNVQSEHSEIQADEMFHATMNTLHDTEQIAIHLGKQDDLILQILKTVAPAPPPQTPPTPDPAEATTMIIATQPRGDALNGVTQPMQRQRVRTRS